MAKINHNNLLETINESIERAKEHDALHLYAEDKVLKGSNLRIFNKDMLHFATTGYLGLEQDIRLKTAASLAIFDYGTQFPLSKTYISHPLYRELEQLLKKMYGGQSLVVFKNSTLTHMGTIPHAVGYNDVVILDHQVHWSVQNACQQLKLRGIPVIMIRHSNMEELEIYLMKFKNTYEKIWYMADGIYSMYGDCLPVWKIKQLMQRYKKFNVYVDDVHGMSWKGANGTGFIQSHWPVIPERMVLVSTLSKTFGASGAFVVSGDMLLITKIRNFGGPLTFSAQLEPSAVAAAIASAKIHLSDEIIDKQERLQKRIDAFQNALVKAGIPLMSTGDTPVFFIPTGMPDTVYALMRKLRIDACFVNPALFPAVPVNNAGLRITVSNHNSLQDIDYLAGLLEKHYNKALVATGNSYKKVGRAFKRQFTPKMEVPAKKTELFQSAVYSSISEIDEGLWNSLLGDHAFDYVGTKFLQEYFSGLDPYDPNHMQFRYHLIKNSSGSVEAFTYTSVSLWKEDMLSHEMVSEKIENIRLENPYFLTEKVMSTGSTFTEGVHLYINSSSKNLRLLQRALFDSIEGEFEKDGCGKLVFRDFTKKFFLYHMAHDRGYLVAEMPDSAVFSDFDWNALEQFEQKLSKRSRRHFRTEVLPYVDQYDVTVSDHLSKRELNVCYQMYCEVKANNFSINNFEYSLSLFEAMNKSPLWQFLILKNKGEKEIQAVAFCYVNKTNNSFNPILVGMNIDHPQRLTLYRQLLFQTILHAKEKGFTKIYMGVSAVFEKKKLGAQIIYREAYIRMNDNYAADLLKTFE